MNWSLRALRDWTQANRIHREHGIRHEVSIQLRIDALLEGNDSMRREVVVVLLLVETCLKLRKLDAQFVAKVDLDTVFPKIRNRPNRVRHIAHQESKPEEEAFDHLKLDPSLAVALNRRTVSIDESKLLLERLDWVIVAIVSRTNMSTSSAIDHDLEPMYSSSRVDSHGSNNSHRSKVKGVRIVLVLISNWW